LKQTLGILAVVITFIGYIPYLKDTIVGKTKPHIFSWVLWSLIFFIAFGLQWSKGAGFGSYVSLAMGVISLIVLILSLKNGVKKVKKIDVVSFILAIIAIILWLVVNQPVWSIILVIIVDIFSFTPTFIKSWTRPREETLLTWFFNIIRQILVLFSIGEINFVTIIFPLYSLIINTAFFTLLVTRRKRVGM